VASKYLHKQHGLGGTKILVGIKKILVVSKYLHKLQSLGGTKIPNEVQQTWATEGMMALGIS